MLNGRCLFIVALLLIPAFPSGQGAPDRPTFKSGVQFIEVDVLATDEDGDAVRDLTKEDFTLLEDDRPQTIANFAYVEVYPDARTEKDGLSVTAALATRAGASVRSPTPRRVAPEPGRAVSRSGFHSRISNRVTTY